MKNTSKKPKKATRATRKRKQCSRVPEEATTEVMGFVRWTDPLRPPSIFKIDAPFDAEAETACVHLDVNLRSVSSIEIRPARRPMNDLKGVVEDALRLANT